MSRDFHLPGRSPVIAGEAMAPPRIRWRRLPRLMCCAWAEIQ
jgi:hypothetical protein